MKLFLETNLVIIFQIKYANLTHLKQLEIKFGIVNYTQHKT